MTHRTFSLRVALTMALAAGALAQAEAADLDPALEDPSPVYGGLPASNVVFGSGWYARGDVAVTNQFATAVRSVSTTAFASGIGSTSRPSYNLSLGGGYAFTNHFRADLIADFFQPSEARLNGLTCPNATSGTNCTLTSTFNRYDALANVYYDIGTWSIVTPYVGAGVGVAFGNIKATEFGGAGLFTGYTGYQKLAFAGMAGAAFDVYPHVKIDVGYRYVNNGRVAGTEIYNHEVRAGLRYMIDN